MIMSAKKARGAKVLRKPPERKQEASPAHNMDSSNLSTVDDVAFLEGLRLKNCDTPLHSTALEEDLNPSVEEGGAGKKDVPKKTAGKQHGPAEKRKQTAGGEEAVMERKKKKMSVTEPLKVRPEKVAAKEERAAAEAGKKGPVQSRTPETSGQSAAAAIRRLVGKKPAAKKAAAKTVTPRAVKSQQLKGKKGNRKAARKTTPKKQLQEQSESDPAEQTSKRVLSTEEEEEMDTSPSPKKARTPRSTAKRTPSSAEGGASEEKAKTTSKRKKSPSARARKESDVVVDAFLQYCDKYRESVESRAVQKSIDTFARNVQGQLEERVSSSKELQVLRRENSKVGSLVRTKTERLLTAKNEMITAKVNLRQVQKEEAQLKQRLADLRRGLGLLTDIRELTGQYLDHRRKRPKQKETYGASSLPALLLEARYLKGSQQKRPKDKKTKALK